MPFLGPERYFSFLVRKITKNNTFSRQKIKKQDIQIEDYMFRQLWYVLDFWFWLKKVLFFMTSSASSSHVWFFFFWKIESSSKYYLIKHYLFLILYRWRVDLCQFKRYSSPSFATETSSARFHSEEEIFAVIWDNPARERSTHLARVL